MIWSTGLFPQFKQLILTQKILNDFLFFQGRLLGILRVLNQIVEVFELSFNSEIQIAQKNFVITVFYLSLVLHSWLVLLKGFLMNLAKIVYPFLHFGLTRCQMCTNETKRSIKNIYPYHHTSFVSELTSHPCLYCVLVKRFEGMFPFLVDIQNHE